MFIGVMIGTYSSVFIATPVVVDLEKKKKVVQHHEPAKTVKHKQVAATV